LAGVSWALACVVLAQTAGHLGIAETRAGHATIERGHEYLRQTPASRIPFEPGDGNQRRTDSDGFQTKPAKIVETAADSSEADRVRRRASEHGAQTPSGVERNVNARWNSRETADGETWRGGGEIGEADQTALNRRAFMRAFAEVAVENGIWGSVLAALTVSEDGGAVSDGRAGDGGFGRCGAGTDLKDGACEAVPASDSGNAQKALNFGSCGIGTVFEAGECVPVDENADSAQPGCACASVDSR
jgi:hypothetical protein